MTSEGRDRGTLPQTHFFPFALFLKKIIYLLTVALGLCRCAWAFSSWGECKLVSSCAVQVSCCGGFSCYGAQARELP